MSEPEIALVFTAEPWVEQLHRYLSDHGGARVRSLVVEQSVALEESYDVLVVSHRWPALTHAFVADVHARSRRVLGVHDRAEAASRAHLARVNVDAVIESDAGSEAFVRALVGLCSERERLAGVAPPAPALRPGRLIGVGGPPGVGRTEVAIQLAVAATRGSTVVLADCDDVAPAVAQRLALPLEPNLRTAIDAVEHGRGDLAACIQREAKAMVAVLGGIPNSTSWMQVRPGEVIRVVDRLGADAELVVVDGIGSLPDLGGPRGRFATARALAIEADVLVAVCDASPVGIARLLAWTVEARALAPSTPIAVVVNRAPSASFRRGELYDEIMSSVDVVEVGFASLDSHVVNAAWEGRPVTRGKFTRAISRTCEVVAALPRRATDTRLVSAS
jgi:MinD-like ATPase involved in chromosome partitioning or flagellar assembly